MDFNLRCACGRDVPVPATAAGAAVDCLCGRELPVPSLGELRRQAGLPAYQASAAAVIEHMVAHRELPTTSRCAGCAGDTEGVAGVTAECEKVRESGSGGLTWLIAFLFLGLWAYLLLLRQTREYGKNLILHLPLRVCPDCERRIVRGSPRPEFGLLIVAATVAGLTIWFFWSIWGVTLVAGALLLWFTGLGRRARQQAAIRGLLLQEPVYGQLLKEYPDATVQLNREVQYT